MSCFQCFKWKEEDIPGMKSGLYFSGVRGPGVEDNEECLQMSLKVNKVAPINGCDLRDCGITLKGIHGNDCRGIVSSEFSKEIQSLFFP